MPAIPGTIVAAQITTGNTANTFSIGDTNEMQGGHHSVATLVDRDAITTERRVEGMTCYVAATITTYQLQGGIANVNWVALSFGAGGNTNSEWRASPVALNDPSVEPPPADASKTTFVLFMDRSPFYIWNPGTASYGP